MKKKYSIFKSQKKLGDTTGFITSKEDGGCEVIQGKIVEVAFRKEGIFYTVLTSENTLL